MDVAGPVCIFLIEEQEEEHEGGQGFVRGAKTRLR